MNELRQTIDKEGFAILPNILYDPGINSLIGTLEGIGDAAGVHRRQSVYAIRNLLDAVPEVRDVAQSPLILSTVERVLRSRPFVVRGILFDKTPDANWKVPWHQDLSIAVRERVDAEGFSPWSQKDGVWHVQPPASVLEGMLTVRLHLDDCDSANGPLQVIPGSHRSGKLNTAAIEQVRQEQPPIVCPVPAGGALLMRPLLLHASSAAEEPARRRVIHLEYAAAELPGGLEWMENGER